MFESKQSLRVYVAVAASLLALPVLAAGVSIQPAVHDLAVDNGPADGVFDRAILAVGPGNNGFTEIRYAAEFPLAAIPGGMRIDAATLSTRISNFEGVRSIEIDGYGGDGTLTMADFGANGALGQATLQPGGTQVMDFDVTSFLQGLLGANSYAGFNLRETPPNSHNFVLFAVETAQLKVAYSPVPLPAPAALLAPAVGLLLLRGRTSSGKQAAGPTLA